MTTTKVITTHSADGKAPRTPWFPRRGRLKKAPAWQLWVMLIPAIGFTALFMYVPMYGIQLAFREFDFTKGLTGGDWVGLKYFIQFFESPQFWTLMRN